MNTCLIICNGELSKRLLDKFLRLNKLRKQIKIICCDGASDFLHKHKITPDYIIGDFDSISKKTLIYFKQKKVTLKKILNQDLTDFEKALKFALTKKLKNIFVVGFSGGRIDHTVSNLSILKRYSRRANIKVYDDTFETSPVSKSIEFDYKKGEIVSLLALPKAVVIKTHGLKWKLNNESLELGKREGISNIATGNHVKIELRKGTLLVFKKHFGSIL
jgi:thiamine pyrophosphokinase